MDERLRYVADTSSIVAGMVDRGPGIAYDRFFLEAGEKLPSTFRMFCVPMGHLDDQGKRRTRADTSMTAGSCFPPPRCMVVQRAGFLVPRISGRPILALPLARWDLTVDDKSRADGPLALDAGWGIVDPENPPETAKGMREIGPLYIAPLQYFNVIVEFPKAGTVLSEDLEFWAVLEGIVDKAVA